MTNTGPCSLRHHGTGVVSVLQKQGVVLDLLCNATVPDVSLFLRNRAADLLCNATVPIESLFLRNRAADLLCNAMVPVVSLFLRNRATDLLCNATVPYVSLFLRNRAMCRNARVTRHRMRPFNRVTGYRSCNVYVT